VSYCETAAVLLEWARDALPGLPAYNLVTFGLKADPFALAAFPGVTEPQVKVGDPLWPVVGF
jgi:hypothetical protein